MCYLCSCYLELVLSVSPLLICSVRTPVYRIAFDSLSIVVLPCGVINQLPTMTVTVTGHADDGKLGIRPAQSLCQVWRAAQHSRTLRRPLRGTAAARRRTRT